MNSWKVRHEGSPVASADVTFQQVMQGLLDGRWEPTDEVRGPTDADWVRFEDHPAFAEAASELEPAPPSVYDDETRLDMTPLIDVSLVLLIFFILTTTYIVELQKIIEAADVSSDKAGKVRTVSKDMAAQTMVYVEVHWNSAEKKATILVEKAPVEPENLVRELSRFTRTSDRKTLLLAFDDKVPHGVVVDIQDKAKTAGMDRVLFVLPEKPPEKK
jgi:biopolymer transport protein ExbD